MRMIPGKWVPWNSSLTTQQLFLALTTVTIETNKYLCAVSTKICSSFEYLSITNFNNFVCEILTKFDINSLYICHL